MEPHSGLKDCDGLKRCWSKAIKSGLATETQSHRGSEEEDRNSDRGGNCSGAVARVTSTADGSMRGTREQLVGGTVEGQLAENFCERESVGEPKPDRPTKSISAEGSVERDLLLAKMEPMIRKLVEHTENFTVEYS